MTVASSAAVDMYRSFGDMLRRDRQNRAPDVLNTIANLSSDEVFTPPEIANRMLDTLAEAWAADHDGATIWADPSVTFLDPATKSGVFLREITKRLVEGQGNPAEGSEERKSLVNRVLTTQVFGIGITTLTSLIARRSIYCSKDATGGHSVAPSSTSPDGNIWFQRTEHKWVERKKERRVDPLTSDEVVAELEGTGKCKWCPAAEASFERGDDLETHAYALIHTDDPKALLTQIFGDNMHFDVIVGNPPYQLSDGGGEKGASAAPIYQKFVQAAKALDPRYLAMITPSRWFAGGKGLDDYRTEMLGDRRMRTIVDFPNEQEVFPGVHVRGGVSYFLWDSAYSGTTSVTTVRSGERVSADRVLDEFDIFVRDARAISILHKVLASGDKAFSYGMSNRNPFGLGSAAVGGPTGDVALYLIDQRKRSVGKVNRSSIKKNPQLIDSWKVLAPKAGLAGDTVPDSVLTKPWIAPPPSVCTESFLVIQVSDKAQALSVASYYSTRFFRFLVSLRKISQNTTSTTYTWVPIQTWDRVWTDSDLYAKYGLGRDEIAYIESTIRPMDLDSFADEE